MERLAGRYGLLKRLGQGGMGEVSLAVDLDTGAEYALKRLTLADGKQNVEMLRAEFEALARVRHPAVVRVIELGFDFEGAPFLVMERVVGWPANKAVDPGAHEAIAMVAARIASGLEALHAAGVVHGDIKPENILVGAPSGDEKHREVRLVDFGLAAVSGRTAEGHRGTPGFTAPEVARGAKPDVSADLYAFGATLFELSAGRPPFEGPDVSTILQRQQAGPPSSLPLEEMGTPATWIRLILQLMSPTPAERPQNAQEVRRAIEQIAPTARVPLIDRMGAEAMIGRDAEIARLEREWRRAHRSARSVVIAGVTGVGKSALVDAFADRATLRNRSVIRVSGSNASRPAAAWRAVARRLSVDARVDLANESNAIRTALDELAPAPDDATLDLVGGAISEWCRVIASHGRAPCILIDDADSLDAASLRAMRRSMLDGESTPSFWLLSRRSDEKGSDDQERLLVSAGASSLLELGPLSRAEVERLVCARLGGESTLDLMDFLWRRAAGHPGLTVESLRNAIAAGAIRENDFGTEIDATALDALPLLSDFEATRVERVRSLSETLQQAAFALAAYERPVSSSTLSLVDTSLNEVALEQLAARGLASQDSDQRWCLLPPALGRRLLELLPEPSRIALHRSILAAGDLSAWERFIHLSGANERALALQAAEIAFSEVRDAQLARNAAELAGEQDSSLAALWLSRAARALMDLGRYQDAAGLLERALALAAAADRGERWGMLCTCRLRIGDLQGLENDARRAREEDLSEQALATIRLNEAARATALGNFAAAAEIARDAAAMAQRCGDLPTFGMAKLSECTVMMNLNRMSEASQAAEESRRAFLQSGHVMGLSRSDGVRAQLLQLAGKLHDAEQLYRSAFEDAQRQHLRLSTEELANGLSGVLITLGKWVEARDLQARALRLALEDGRALGAVAGMITLAQLDGLMGSLDAARSEVKRARRLCREHAPSMTSYMSRVDALVLRNSGRPARARKVAETGAELARQAGFAGEIDWCVIELARACARLGDWKLTSQLTEAALSRNKRLGHVADVALAVLAGRSALRTGHPDHALQMLALIRSWPETNGAYAAAIGLQLQAEIALLQEDGKDAAEVADEALRAFDELPAAPERVSAAFEFARLAIESRAAGDSAIERWLEQAVAGFERLGDRRGREFALALSLRWIKESRAGQPDPTRERNLIGAMVQLLDSMSDFTELTQRAMRLAVEQLNAERGVLLLVDAESHRLESRAEYGAMDAATRREAVTYSRGIVERVTESGGSLLIYDAPTSPLGQSASMKELRLQSVLCVPMRHGGHLVGAVYLDHSKRRGAFSQADQKQLESFAELMTLAIENSRGAEQVRLANEKLTDENLSLRQEVQNRFHLGGIVGSSAAMLRVLSVAERASQVDATVLITGENGTGKERIARVLHFSGKRKGGPFVAINCGAFPEALLESELFGHMKGAFTDAKSDHVGRFLQANGGTLFLDEIGEMPTNQQVKLLSVLANREVMPLRGRKAIPIDVRIIAATNQNLGRRISEGAFRPDLFYRLNVIPIEVPPLRDRKADIPPLARHFVQTFAKTQHREVPEMSPEFIMAIMQSNWPGNVRELENYVERIMAMSPSKILYPSPLPADLEGKETASPGPRRGGLADQLAEFERRAIQQALESALGNQSKAARALKLTEQTLRYRMKKHEVGQDRKNLRTRKKPR